MNKIKDQIHQVLVASFVIITGLIIFKYIPMKIWGADILFDASSHVAWTVFALYIIWFFIDQNKTWKIPYFIFSGAIIIIMAIQRIISKNHNEIGVTLGLIIGLLGIAGAEHLFKRLKF